MIVPNVGQNELMAKVGTPQPAELAA